MQKDMWPVEKLALAVISGMIVERMRKSHTQTNNAMETSSSISKRVIIPGLGNFDIVLELRTFAMDAARWTKKNAEQQERHFLRFLQASVRTHAHTVTSSDGNVTVLESADGGKKNQVKCKRTAKTSSTKCRKV